MAFSPKDIIRIIKACQKSQISTLKCGDLEINLTVPRRNGEPKHAKIAVDETIATQLELEAIDQASEELVSRELDELLISDPAAYEAKLASGELVDEKS